MTEEQRKSKRTNSSDPEESMTEADDAYDGIDLLPENFTIDPSWKDEFAPQILARGRKYYEEGRVSQMIQHGNRIVAHVDGTEEYCVEIDLPVGVPDNWLCTCPYAVRGNCKHKAAVLFAVEAGAYTFTDDTDDPLEFEEDLQMKRPPLPWYDALEKLPADTLRKFLVDFAGRNDDFREYLSIWYLHGLPEGLLEQWKADLQAYANMSTEGRRYVPDNEVYFFMRGVYSAFKDRFLLLQKVGATMDAFYWLGTVFEIVSRKVYADKEGAFDDFYSDCVADWNILADEATEQQREQMLAWFWEHRAAFFAHAQDAIDIEFLYLPWGDALERKGLEIVDELIANCRNDQELAMLMDCRVEIMDFLDCSHKEVWDFWKQHLSHDYARHRLLENYYIITKERRYILPLLEQLKEMDAGDLPRSIQDSVWLAMWYKEEHAEEAYQSERVLLLTEHRQALEKELPVILDRKSARRFIACLDALRSLKDADVNQMIEELVDKLCSNPAIARKGIVEIVNRAGYEWPKAYWFGD